jgi:CspA family cold shock protein
MSETEGTARRATGQIKWFDPTRGFGFVLDDAGGPDILLHANVLRNYGQNSISEAARVEVLVLQTGRGMQAVEVLTIETSGTAPPPPPLADLLEREALRLEDLPFQPARVKWFDKAKGFGFANVFAQPGDVFLHIEVLRHGGFADLTTGEAVALKVVDGRRGRMAAQVGSWERVLATTPPAPAVEETQQATNVVPMAPPLSPIGSEALAQPGLLVAEPSE